MVIRKIAHKYGVSQSIVSRIFREHEPEVSRNKSRRLTHISLNIRRPMVYNIIIRNLNNAIQVQKYLEEELEITISANRVRQILKQEDLTAQHKKKRPKLTRAHI
jgi:transposase